MTAVEYARKNCVVGVDPGDIVVGDFGALGDYGECAFDFVLDRCSITCAQDKNGIINDVLRILKSGGYFLSFLYRWNDRIDDDYCGAYLVTRGEIDELFDGFNVVEIATQTIVAERNKSVMIPNFDVYVVLARKSIT
jgi:SAM-dependent methyltransferase